MQVQGGITMKPYRLLEKTEPLKTEEAAQALSQAQALLSYFSTRQQKKQEFCHKKAENHIG